MCIKAKTCGVVAQVKETIAYMLLCLLFTVECGVLVPYGSKMPDDLFESANTSPVF